MATKIERSGAPTQPVNRNEEPPAPQQPDKPAAPPEPAKPAGWLATAAAKGRALSSGAKEAQEWVHRQVDRMERVTAGPPNGESGTPLLHFGSSVVGGYAEGVSKMVTGLLEVRGRVMQLGEAGALAREGENLKAIGSNLGHVPASIASAFMENPGHALGEAASFLSPFSLLKLAGVGRAAPAAIATEKAAAAAAEAARGAQVAKVAAVRAENAAAQAVNIVNAQHAVASGIPRSAKELMKDLELASPNHKFLEGVSTLRHPPEMGTLVDQFMKDAPSLFPELGPVQAQQKALETMRNWVNDSGAAARGTASEWNKAFNRIGATIPAPARAEAELFQHLMNANPANFVGEAFQTLRHPVEMRAVARYYLAKAAEYMPGETPTAARAIAMGNMRYMADRLALPGTGRMWTHRLNALSRQYGITP